MMLGPNNVRLFFLASKTSYFHNKMQCSPKEKKMTIFTLTGVIWETSVILATHSSTAGSALKVLVFDFIENKEG